MTNKEFIENVLDVDSFGHEEDGEYVIELESSDDFQYAYLKLDNSEDLYLDNCIVSETENTFVFVNDNYVVELIADFDNGTYAVITRQEGEE